MTAKLADVWTTRDYPVLVEVVRRLDSGERHVMADDVAVSLGIDRVGLPPLGAPSSAGSSSLPAARWPLRSRRSTTSSGDAYLITGLHPDGDDAVQQACHRVPAGR